MAPKKSIKQLPTDSASKPNLFGLYISVMVLMLLIIGLSFSNIIHFAIEDAYNLPLKTPLFFGLEYATSGAWLIITTFVFLGFVYWYQRQLTKYPHLFNNSIYNLLLKSLLGLGCIIAFFYIVSIIYSFLNGDGDIAGLMRIAVTLAILAMGMLFVITQLYYRQFTLTKFYFVLVSAIGTAMIITSFILIAIFSSPQLLREAKLNYRKYENLNHISRQIERYFNNFKKLPETVTDMEKLGFLKNLEFDMHNYNYSIVTPRSFDVCTKLKFDSNVTRRVYSHSDAVFKKGLQCQRGFQEVNDGKYSLKLIMLTPFPIANRVFTNQ